MIFKNKNIINIMDKITIFYKNNIYIIDKEPYETINDTYNRGWYIVKNYNKYDYKLLYTQSIINNNNLHYNMIYDKE